MAYIEIESVTYELNTKPKRTLYRDLNLSLKKGEMAALIGPNGVGKTTITKMILGFLQPDSGQVLVDGLKAVDYRRPDMGQKIGYLFQNPSLQLFSARVEEELLFAYEVRGSVTDSIRQRCHQIIDGLSLREAMMTPVFHLSQGEKQRLAIGTLLMNDPDYLILDEPTSGLDGDRKAMLKEILLGLNREGIGMLIISHDQDFLEGLPVTTYHMDEGQVTLDG